MTSFQHSDPAEEAWVRDYLLKHPDFFQRNEDIFGTLLIPRNNPEGSRSIIECQNEVLQSTLARYEYERAQERKNLSRKPSVEQLEKIIELADRLMECRDDASLPYIAMEGCKDIFNVRFGHIRLWHVQPNFSFLPFAEPIGREAEEAIAAMQAPYFGPNQGDVIAQWIGTHPKNTRGVLMNPLRLKFGQTFGFICLASPDPGHFDALLETDVLKKVGQIVEAALSRLTR